MHNINTQRVAVRELLLNLASEGFKVVLAGGACRDWLHCNVPKDYDILDLDAEQYLLDYEDLEHAARVVKLNLNRIPGVEVTEVLDSYREQAGRLLFVIKFTYEGLDFDYIAYGSCPSDPTQQVEEFDTNLNMVWYAATEDTLVLHPECSKVYNEESPVRPLSSCDGDRQKRLDYQKAKYPQYNYVNEVLHV